MTHPMAGVSHRVSARLTDCGFSVLYQGRTYSVGYPDDVWKQTPETVRLFLLDNLVYAMTMHLPMVVPGLTGLIYDTRRPMLEPWFFQNFIRDIPSCTDMLGQSADKETARFLSHEYSFAGGEMRSTQSAVPPGKTATAGAIVPMSFGKDSLLSFAVAEELGLRPVMVYVVEPGFANEERHKLSVAREFQEEFGHELFTVEHDTGALRDTEYGWGLQSTEYALLMLPFAWATGASLILFGNEQSAGSSYLDENGRTRIYPCYDQTHDWTLHIDQMTSLITNGYVRTGSLIEPLMDMLVQRFLAHRYPHYAAYQMSCFVEYQHDPEQNGELRWCHDCTICAKMYLLCVASGIEPAAIGLRNSMLTEDKRELYPLLGGNSAFPYARTALARDEQLFAFFCAAQRGSREDLVLGFAASPLYKEAEHREPELRTRFCTLYPPTSTPLVLRAATSTIYREELDRFIRPNEEHTYENCARS